MPTDPNSDHDPSNAPDHDSDYDFPAPPDSIGELVIAGDFGFKEVTGPFEAEKSGTVWTLIAPADPADADSEQAAEAARQLATVGEREEGEAAVLLTEDEVVGGGVVTESWVPEPDGPNERHVLVDQYALEEVE